MRLFFETLYIDSYQNFRITAKQKSTIDTQIRKINSNTTLKIVIKLEEEKTRENGKKKEQKKKGKTKSKAINKIAIRTYM